MAACSVPAWQPWISNVAMQVPGMLPEPTTRTPRNHSEGCGQPATIWRKRTQSPPLKLQPSHLRGSVATMGTAPLLAYDFGCADGGRLWSGTPGWLGSG